MDPTDPTDHNPDSNELTPAELHCLLHDDEAQIPDASPAAFEPSHAIPTGALVTVENFTRDFATQLAATLTERLQIGVSAEVTRVTCPSFGEFVDKLPRPTCFQVIHTESLNAPIFWQWSTHLLFPLLDRLLGGGQLPPTMARRALTNIELRLVRNVSEQLLQLFATSWRPALVLEPRLDRIESDARDVTTVGDDTLLWVAELQIDLGTHHGPLQIAFTQSSLAAVAEELIAASKKPSTHVNVSVILAESFLDRQELLDLRVGDILTTDAASDDAAAIYMDDEFEHHGQPGAHGGYKAVRIT